ncbi:hypothetical protein SARC_09780 [Sphaeroforma arctica JP610]|uniref:Uncharacterized protein n=1 Tax=Sphaeroforma arctica JP610 TaxID=667725 RepID=A0A0L0FLY4_9EUKA|nr:hypothetical protein SARC_09780 [Sphaeroforma arctica JP610]KNC77765.1 hypothetical protein SARC_09780 [Sphaeroforma arctica JP610]|eukprot:XP_014151667.1 hypothetical protein SARC_09780 [Sphaeroforma arctica JP610]
MDPELRVVHAEKTVDSNKFVKDVGKLPTTYRPDRKDRKDPIDTSILPLLSRSKEDFGQIMQTANSRKNR